VIERHDFDIHFQPVVDIATGRIEAQEALVRFRDGHTPADVFHSELRLERLVDLELAIVAAAIDAAHRLPAGVSVNVNVTPAAALDDRLASLLHDAERPVVLEITENDRFTAADAVLLRSRVPADCQIAADDVGAGFAGLSQLVGVRPDVVKIDRELVRGLHRDPARQVVVAGLVRFADETGADLIAEGIEERAEADQLLQLGVRLGQGYLFGRPAPIADLTCAVGALVHGA
jgi:EAL domain-containing protein (putative c-di-GMP-specific phosphodiesterase class I)